MIEIPQQTLEQVWSWISNPILAVFIGALIQHFLLIDIKNIERIRRKGY
jgi:hypothetical protein